MDLESLCAEHKRWKERLTPLRREWIAWTRNATMSASLSTVALACAVAARNRGPVLDLGSGFSSAAFRMMGDPVVTIDDDADWLEKTGGFLDAHRIGRGELRAAERWDDAGFSTVFYDLGDIRMRYAQLSNALGSVGPGGFIVVDDTHYNQYRSAVRKALEASGFKSLPDEVSRRMTLDRFGRWSLLAYRSEPSAETGYGSVTLQPTTDG